jgi:tetratricopeptide (TPR) repeat protein
MKICPFVSHMLGDENSDTLTLDTPSTSPSGKKKGNKASVVVLGYADGEAGQAETGTDVATKEAPEQQSTLFCLKESCRFYHADTSDCQFDIMFSMLQEHGEVDFDLKLPNLDGMAKNIDKVWKFQTKSVSELVKSISDSEKKQGNAVEAARADLTKTIANLGSKMDKSAIGDVKKDITEIRKNSSERHKTLEDLSTTMSDLVLNLHESINQLQDKSEQMFKQVTRIETSMPEESNMRKLVDNAISTRLDAFSIDEPMQRLEDRLTQVVKDHQDSDGFEEMQATATAQREMKASIAELQHDIMEKLQDIKMQQKVSEERFRSLAEQQEQLVGFYQEGQKNRNDSKTKASQKEAKKFNNLGVTSFHNGAFEMARDQFLQAVRADSDFAEAYNNLGLAYTELRQEEKATDAFSKAVELNPELDAAYNNLGYIYFKSEQYDRAIEMYNEALGRSSDNSSAYTNLGNAYYKLSKTDEAREAWTKALEIDPGNEKAKMNLRQIDGD